jgi:hypothetical protein
MSGLTEGELMVEELMEHLDPSGVTAKKRWLKGEGNYATCSAKSETSIFQSVANERNAHLTITGGL